ncbi:hypothetical protein [Methylobacterium sp. CM6257]
MTHFNGDPLPTQQQERTMPRWLALAITALALNVPIAGLFLIMGPVLLQRPSFAAERFALICVGSAAVIIGAVMAAFVGRERSPCL